MIVFETWVHIREHVVYTCFTTPFKTTPPAEFSPFFLLATITRIRNNCTSTCVGEKQFSRAVTPDPPNLFHGQTGIAAVRAIPPAPQQLQEQGCSLQHSHGPPGSWPCQSSTAYGQTGSRQQGATDSTRLDWTVHEQPDVLYPFR